MTCSEMDIALKAIESYEGEEENSMSEAVDGCIAGACIRILPNGLFCWDDEFAESTAGMALKYIVYGVRRFLAQVSE